MHIRSDVPYPWDPAAPSWYLVHVGTVVPYPWDHAAPPWYLLGMYDLMFLPVRSCSPALIRSRHVLSGVPVRSCSPVLILRRHVGSLVPNPWDPAASSLLIPRRHVRSGLPNPWDPAAPSWYLVGMYDLVFRAREIMQHRSDTSYQRSIWCVEPVRSWIHLLIPSRHVRSVVPNPWDPATPTWYLVGRFDLIFLTREILQPRPDTLKACTIWCSEPVRSCSHVLIPRRHVGSVVPNPWDPAAPS